MHGITQPGLRTYCRQCGSKLPGTEPVEHRHAFCTTTCRWIFYRKHCEHCDQPTSREARDHVRNYCSRRCRTKDENARRGGVKARARTLPPALTGIGPKTSTTTGFFSAPSADRGPAFAWVRQADEYMWVGREDGEVLARVYPV